MIDDDDSLRGSIGSLLRSSGFVVALYGSTDAFLAAGVPAVAACLVLDIRLRGESGLDFQDRLLADGITIPVILITGHGDIPMTVRGMRAGAIDFLQKPFEDEDLTVAVTKAIETDRSRRLVAASAAVLLDLYRGLTPREQEVMGFVVTGLMNKQIAARMTLSDITVKIHRGSLMRKMNAQSLADLVRMAELLGIRDDSIHRYNA
ncbi:response regulator transcription factor [Sphingomonas sp. H160509]|uniref:response regulator transcription factor n=1 Tax=Sphingomonas sp. H160509 TaxID=2955313 RepID=UPI0031582C50